MSNKIKFKSDKIIRKEINSLISEIKKQNNDEIIFNKNYIHNNRKFIIKSNPENKELSINLYMDDYQYEFIVNEDDLKVYIKTQFSAIELKEHEDILNALKKFNNNEKNYIKREITPLNYFKMKKLKQNIEEILKYSKGLYNYCGIMEPEKNFKIDDFFDIRIEVEQLENMQVVNNINIIRNNSNLENDNTQPDYKYIFNYLVGEKILGFSLVDYKNNNVEIDLDRAINFSNMIKDDLKEKYKLQFQDFQRSLFEF